MLDDVVNKKRSVLQGSNFGARVAEDESGELADYFVETDQWKRLLSGDVDIVYGAKGSGKSALYSLLVDSADTLFDRGIVILAAEKPRGTPAFKGIVQDPPTSQEEFVTLWKLYLLCLVAELLRDYGVQSPSATRVLRYLEDARLIENKRSSLQKLVGVVRAYARRLGDAEAVDGGATIDPATGFISGVHGRITLGEPTGALSEGNLMSIDSLFADANRSLQELDFNLWLALDRLDVAFADEGELEANALRALFLVYLDLLAYDRITLKIFLRSDIWRRIMQSGFREASHITRNLTIQWNRQALLNLVVRRLLRNSTIRDYCGVSEPDDVYAGLSDQEALYARIFPDQVDAGPNKPSSFDWMLGRTRDGTTQTAPRELIHLLSSLRESQLRRFELGHSAPPGEALFDRAAFKEALPEVSKIRLEQTLFAEYPTLKPLVEKLDQQKTQQTQATLARIWDLSELDARSAAESLADVGFFERRTAKDRPVYWVPFLYRDALNMVQGSADGTIPDEGAVTEQTSLLVDNRP